MGQKILYIKEIYHKNFYVTKICDKNELTVVMYVVNTEYQRISLVVLYTTFH